MVKRKSGKLPPTKSAKKALRRQGKLRKTVVPKGVIRDAWDEKLTTVQNIERIGLAAAVNAITPNNAQRRRRSIVGVRTCKNDASTPPCAKEQIERLDVREKLVYEASRPEKEMKQVVRPGEERALREMVSAYGDDYERMALDIKRNYLQFTPAQLRRKCERRSRILASESSAC